MPSLPECPETQWLGVRGVEVSPMPDGRHAVRLATAEGPMQARLREVAGAREAVVLTGPADFVESLARLDEKLAAEGISTLTLAEGRVTTADQLRAARGFLWLRGVRQLAVLAAGTKAAPVLAGAGNAGWSLVALLSPSADTDPAQLDALRGQPLLVLCGEEASVARALARAAGVRAELVEFPGSGPALGATSADLASAIVPRLARALREVPPA